MAFNRLTNFFVDEAILAGDPSQALELRKKFLELQELGFKDISIEEAIRILKGEQSDSNVDIAQLFENFPQIEMNILKLLYSYLSTDTPIVPREVLLTTIWGDEAEEMSFSNLSQAFARIKRRCEENTYPFTIENVYGKGYRLVITNKEA